jgi:putative FmdB family regulatory protein
MPLYDYRCTQCGNVTEVRHGFNDVHSERCAKCGGELGRVFNPAPILFKGSGFYITDSRPAGSASGEASPSASPSSASSSSSDSSKSGDSAA